MIHYLFDRRERYFDDLAVAALYLDAGCCERLRHLHAADYAAYAIAVRRDNLNVVLAVERAQGCEGFCYFHYLFTALSSSIDGRMLIKYKEDSEPIASVSIKSAARGLIKREQLRITD